MFIYYKYVDLCFYILYMMSKIQMFILYIYIYISVFAHGDFHVVCFSNIYLYTYTYIYIFKGYSTWLVLGKLKLKPLHTKMTKLLQFGKTRNNKCGENVD